MQNVVKRFLAGPSCGKDKPDLKNRFPNERSDLKKDLLQKKRKIEAVIEEHEGRVTVGEISEITGIPRSTVQDNLVRNGITTTYLYAKPLLSPAHMAARLAFVLEKIK